MNSIIGIDYNRIFTNAIDTGWVITGDQLHLLLFYSPRLINKLILCGYYRGVTITGWVLKSSISTIDNNAIKEWNVINLFQKRMILIANNCHQKMSQKLNSIH